MLTSDLIASTEHPAHCFSDLFMPDIGFDVVVAHIQKVFPMHMNANCLWLSVPLDSVTVYMTKLRKFDHVQEWIWSSLYSVGK
ncbi:hypothetical protein SUGI_0980560 [Cryptomeria japonica]|nr:hypothetical protein SUGI_0980560 [Cryptomeria japonica]